MAKLGDNDWIGREMLRSAILTFPQDRTCGRLYVRPSIDLLSGSMTAPNLTIIADACGFVEIAKRDDQHIVLRVNAPATADLSWLSMVPNHALDEFVIFDGPLSAEGAHLLNRLTSLKALRLHTYGLAGSGYGFLNSLSKLQSLDLHQTWRFWSGYEPPKLDEHALTFIRGLDSLHTLNISGVPLTGVAGTAIHDHGGLRHVRCSGACTD